MRYTLRSHPADAHRFDPAAQLSPTSALDTLKLLSQYLIAGKIEDAALLSNAPKRRHEVLQDYQQKPEKEFRTVFEQYFTPRTGWWRKSPPASTLLIWHLAQTDRYAGLFFVRIAGHLMDDVPSETRLQLRRLLEAYRAGSLR